MPSPVQCHDVLEAIEVHGLSPLPEIVREHLSDCPECQGIVADFQCILSAAHELPAEVEPPARVWLSLRAQLVAEGVIRENVFSETVPAENLAISTPWWPGFSALLHGQALAIAAVGVLLFAAAVFEVRHNSVLPVHPATQSPVVAETSNPTQFPTEPQAPAQPPPTAAQVLRDSGATLRTQERELHTAQNAGTLPSSPVDDSLQQDLVTLDAFITDCEQHLQANPEDQLARQYLAAAYQQKAELLAEMLDRGRSVN
jgi:hypothetical protein